VPQGTHHSSFLKYRLNSLRSIDASSNPAPLNGFNIMQLSANEAYRRSGDCWLCIDFVDFIVRERRLKELMQKLEGTAPKPDE
jgi:hypothetical protein